MGKTGKQILTGMRNRHWYKGTPLQQGLQERQGQPDLWRKFDEDQIRRITVLPLHLSSMYYVEIQLDPVERGVERGSWYCLSVFPDEMLKDFSTPSSTRSCRDHWWDSPFADLGWEKRERRVEREEQIADLIWWFLSRRNMQSSAFAGARLCSKRALQRCGRISEYPYQVKFTGHGAHTLTLWSP